MNPTDTSSINPVQPRSASRRAFLQHAALTGVVAGAVNLAVARSAHAAGSDVASP